MKAFFNGGPLFIFLAALACHARTTAEGRFGQTAV
jgi:hypothetical protein